jgi:threonine/homoserine/homoserine lactone efflux protein
MVRVDFFYALTPFVIVFGTAVLLTIPYLALIALLLVLLAALAALAWAIIAVPYMFVANVRRRWSRRSNASRQPATALSPSRHQRGSAGRVR